MVSKNLCVLVLWMKEASAMFITNVGILNLKPFSRNVRQIFSIIPPMVSSINNYQHNSV